MFEINRYKMAVECPTCGEVVLGEDIIDYTNPAGVVVLDLFACTDFKCKKCGTKIWTGDSYSLYEFEEMEEDDNE
jgi:endogenous inhibitor of DNA gyrase (YacG/DUF329 family)